MQAMKYMMDTDDLANKLKAFSLTAVAVKVRSVAMVHMVVCITSGSSAAVDVGLGYRYEWRFSQS